MTKTAAELRQMAADADRAREESFQRSDTDGFLSQWAHGLSAQQYRAQADIAERGGVAKFTGLYEGDRRVIARSIETQFGRAWLLDDAEAARFGRKFIPTGTNSRVQKKLGLSQRSEWQQARAEITGSGRGLSGNAWVHVVRIGDLWGRDATLVQEEEGA